MPEVAKITVMIEAVRNRKRARPDEYQRALMKPVNWRRNTASSEAAPSLAGEGAVGVAVSVIGFSSRWALQNNGWSGKSSFQSRRGIGTPRDAAMTSPPDRRYRTTDWIGEDS